MDDPDKRRIVRWRRLIVASALVALAAFGLTDVRRRARIDPLDPRAHKTDLTIFTTAGAAFLADQQPYAAANPRGWKYCYPPLLAVALAPLSALNPQSQALLWYAASVVMLGLVWFEAARISARWGWELRLLPDPARGDRTLWDPRRLPAWAAVFAAALPILNTLQRGQVGILNLWLLLWGFRLLIESQSLRHAVAGGAMLALPAAIKLTPALPAVVGVAVWGLQRWRAGDSRFSVAGAAGLALGACLWLLAVPGAILGWETNLRHLHDWGRTIAAMGVEVDAGSSVETPFTVRNQSLSNAVYRCGNWIDHLLLGGPDDRAIDAVPFNPDHHLAMDAAWVGPTVLAARLLVLGLLLAAAWRVGRRGTDGELAAVFGLACVASLIVSPLSRGHYFVLLLPGALWLPLALQGRVAAGRWRLLLATPAALTLLHYGLLDIAGRIGLLGLGIAGWQVAATVLLWLAIDRRGADRAADETLEPVWQATLPPRRSAAA